MLAISCLRRIKWVALSWREGPVLDKKGPWRTEIEKEEGGKEMRRDGSGEPVVRNTGAGPGEERGMETCLDGYTTWYTARCRELILQANGCSKFARSVGAVNLLVGNARFVSLNLLGVEWRVGRQAVLVAPRKMLQLLFVRLGAAVPVGRVLVGQPLFRGWAPLT